MEIDELLYSIMSQESASKSRSMMMHAKVFNLMSLDNSGAKINNALNNHIVSTTHKKRMMELGLFTEYGISVDGLNKLFLPTGMRFECYEGVVFLIDRHDEVIYSMDYRLAAYDLPSVKVLSPYPYKEDIRQLAYQLWLDQGCPEGCDRIHWYEAKSRLTCDLPTYPSMLGDKASTENHQCYTYSFPLKL